MGFVVNLALLILGTTGALAAFGGETWKKGEEPLLRRITARGWLALACMVATLTLGIAKEIRNTATAAEAAARQRELENVQSDLKKELTRTTDQLSDTRTKLAAVEPNILQAMIVATAGIRRETDFSTASVDGQPLQALISGRTGAPLALYGGDHLDYTIFCDEAAGRTPGSSFGRRPADLILHVGSTAYPLDAHGRQMIIGPVGQPMQAELRNVNRVRDCILKMLVESADRTREAKQLEPLIKMIQEARATLPKQ